MARTFRRKHERQEYSWVLRELKFVHYRATWTILDPKSKAGLKAIARFHSDATVTMRGTAPRWFRKASDHRIRTRNDRMLRRWIADPGFDPVFQVSHMHDADWSWW
jgi:hypothetical protein